MANENHADDPPPGEPGWLKPKVSAHQPPPALEDRVVHELERRALLSPTRTGVRSPAGRRIVAFAAALALFAAGIGVGRRTGDTGSDAAAPRFMLLLYDSANAAGTTALAESDVDAHRKWARDLAARGHFVYGEKLAPGEVLLETGIAARPEAPTPLAGFFVVSAADAAEAASIARSCPHAVHGGRVAIRPVERT